MKVRLQENDREAREGSESDFKAVPYFMVNILFSQIGAFGTKGDNLHKPVMEIDGTL